MSSALSRFWALLRQYRAVLGATAGALYCVFLVSCVANGRAIEAFPTSVPGARFVGSEACAKCHGEIKRGFHDATHAALVRTEADGKVRNVACESCHGPASAHVAAGTRTTINNPKLNPTTCLQCHINARAEFSLQHTHPVLDGKIGCTACHNPHEGEAHVVDGGARTLAPALSQSCAKCHPAQATQFTFEHEALREGCTTCHAPHGSPNDKMLKTRSTALCYQCHFQSQNGAAATSIIHGGVDHAGNVVRGTCWATGCHEAVHGSNVNSSLRY